VALAGGPELLVLDEPPAAMDIATRRSEISRNPRDALPWPR
jgi:ABC-type taurine transport system ATPase subunit